MSFHHVLTYYIVNCYFIKVGLLHLFSHFNNVRLLHATLMPQTLTIYCYLDPYKYHKSPCLYPLQHPSRYELILFDLVLLGIPGWTSKLCPYIRAIMLVKYGPKSGLPRMHILCFSIPLRYIVDHCSDVGIP